MTPNPFALSEVEGRRRGRRHCAWLIVLALTSCSATTHKPGDILLHSNAPCESNGDCSLTTIPAVATNCCPTCTIRPIPRDELVELAQWCAASKKSQTCEQLDCSASGSHRIKVACVRSECVTVAAN